MKADQSAWLAEHERLINCVVRLAKFTQYPRAGKSDRILLGQAFAALLAHASARPTLSDEQIVKVAEACGLCCIVKDASYRADALWYDGEHFTFARDLLAEAALVPEQKTDTVHVTCAVPSDGAKTALSEWRMALDDDATKFLRDYLNSTEEPPSLTLSLGTGHDGHGLYVWETEYPEEGCSLVQASTPAAGSPSPDEQAPVALSPSADDARDVLVEKEVEQLRADNLRLEAEKAMWIRRADKTWHEKQFTDEIARLRSLLATPAPILAAPDVKEDQRG